MGTLYYLIQFYCFLYYIQLGMFIVCCSYGYSVCYATETFARSPSLKKEINTRNDVTMPC